MESSNAGSEVSIGNSNNTDQSTMSPVPDLVTDVPASAQTPTSAAPTVSSASTVTTTNTTNPPNKTDSPKAHVAPGQPLSSNKSSTTAAPKSTSTNPPRATSLPSAASEASVKNRSTREEKARKKDDKSVDHVLRALNSLNTTEEKLAAMCKKYADIFDEHRKLQLLNKQTDKRCSMLQREKEQLQAEHSKAILTRSRLENLCRELQRQNKAIKDESLLKIREEEEKRKEVSAKFQTTMNEITTLMQQNNDKNMKLRDDNIDMTTKLKSICEQYELRQQQVERISKQMQLEQQLADAKLSKLKMEMAAEREILLREKQQLLLELQQYQQRCTEFQATEVNLRNQISMYNDKYDEFQKALARSNDVFGGFKGEMEKMSKKICKLEKETSSWKQRWERSHNALLEMAADKQKSEQELSVVSRQLATLQNLCRTLQNERSNLLAKLKTFQGGHEPPEKPVSTMPEKCSKQCEQVLNHVEQPEPVTHVVESDPVLQHYTQDILASFKEAVAAEDAVTPGTIITTADCAAPVCSDTTSPLPDIVGTTSPCVNHDSELFERLANENFFPQPPSESVGQDNSSGDKIPIVPDIETNLPVVQEPPSLDQPIQSSVIVENVTSQVVLNGDAHINGSPMSELDAAPIQPSPPKSPTAKASPAKSGDNVKKTKESTKKKKK